MEERERFDTDEYTATVRASSEASERGEYDLAEIMDRYAFDGLPDPATLTPWDAARDEHLSSLGVPVEPPRVA